jgi:hypothetical protein
LIFDVFATLAEIKLDLAQGFELRDQIVVEDGKISEMLVSAWPLFLCATGKSEVGLTHVGYRFAGSGMRAPPRMSRL